MPASWPGAFHWWPREQRVARAHRESRRRRWEAAARRSGSGGGSSGTMPCGSATVATAAALTPVVDPPAGSDLQVRPEDNQSSCQHLAASAQVARPGPHSFTPDSTHSQGDSNSKIM